MSLIFAVLIIVIGFILLLMEIFLIPGLTVFGIMGTLAVIGGIIYSYFLNPAYALYTFLGSLAISGILVASITKSKTWDKLVQHTSENLLDGFRSSDEDLEFLLGKKGYALTHLRPAGTAIIDDERVDVISMGIFIDKNTPIKVVKVEGNKVVVSPLESN